MLKRFMASLAISAAIVATPAQARVDKITVHGTSLEGNYEGNDTDRRALVYLPADYDENPDKRYPVIYFLHGFFLTDEGYADFVDYEDAMKDQDMILVMHDSLTRYKGSMYSASPASGDFEAFVAEDLVSYMDHNYRTIADRESRGLAGHSMGGFGTLKIGMDYPEVFSSIYSMSACCLMPRLLSSEEMERFSAMTEEDMANAGFGDAATLASLSAWAPSPEGPHYFDHEVVDGEVPLLTLARFAAGTPLVTLPGHVRGLKTMEAIGIEIGENDLGLVGGNRLMHSELARFGVPHEYSEHDGDHTNRLKERTRTHMLPFFDEHLDKQGE
jgi:enterochelin esterase-like enzyme